MRPSLTGAAYGLAVGLMTDAGVRLFCWIDEPLHVFAGHGGALAATLIERAKYRRLRRRKTGSRMDSDRMR